MAKSRWWTWKPTPGSVPAGDYEVQLGVYSFGLEVEDPDDLFLPYPPQRRIMLMTSQEVFDSLTSDADELNPRILHAASRVYRLPLAWADNQWHWNRNVEVMQIRLQESTRS